MPKVKITTEIRKQMVAMREQGATYPEIQVALGVTKERCMTYLKGVSPKIVRDSAISEDWRVAELEAREVLEKFGFGNIHNLNLICSFPPYWDYLAEKAGEWWLIDVTVSGQKSIAAKRESLAEGYRHAILLKSMEGWKLILITMSVECEIPIKR